MMKTVLVAEKSSGENIKDEFESFSEVLAVLEKQIDALYDLTPYGAFLIDDQGVCQSVNDHALAWLGCSREELVGEYKLLNPKLEKKWHSLSNYGDQNLAQPFSEIELDLMSDAGVPRRFKILRSAVRRDDMNSRNLYRSVFFDITEKKRLMERQRIAALAFDAQMGICIIDSSGSILEINAAFSKITGFYIEDLRGKAFENIFLLEKNLLLLKEVREKIIASGYWEGEIRDKKKDGSALVVSLNISAVRTESDSALYYVGCFYDITVSKANQEEIHNLAYFDTLTQLPNRRKLNIRLARNLSVIARSHLRGAVLFIDLDNFKSINDTKGHSSGDLLLIEVGNRLLRAVREEDTVARVGGDEFVVLLGDLSSSLDEACFQARAVGNKILASLSIPYQFNNFSFNCSASVGIAMFEIGDQPEEIFQRADMAMYKSKKEGRNSLRFFDPVMRDAATACSSLEQELGAAIKLNQFVLFLQPQFNAKGNIRSAEALLRWNHPERGLIHPGEFISIAEDSGLIISIGFWVVQEICRFIKAWGSDATLCDLHVSINVSPRQFQDDAFVNKILEIIQESGINPSCLTFELTERMMHNIEQIKNKMDKLHQLGVRFSLDDFGTGYSSLSSLIKLPLEQLKIDRSFVKNIEVNTGDRIIVKTIIAMAKNLGMEVIAEGLETQNERFFLDEHGCSLYQGYMLSPPLPVDEFVSFVRSR